LPQPLERSEESERQEITMTISTERPVTLPAVHENLDALPAGDLVLHGLSDLASGIETEAALLVSIGAPRLRQAGLTVPPAFDSPDERLWALLGKEDLDSAHSRYNAYIRRLISFERALECGAR
jgi:hypothetical protein